MEYINEHGIFNVDCPTELVVCSEIEWKISFKPSKDLKENASLKIIVPAYQHQNSEEYLQCYDYWKPNYIYAYGEEDTTKVDVKIEKVPTEFVHINKWNDSSRVAIVYFENGLKKDEEIHIKFGGIDRPWINGECKPTIVTQFAIKSDSCLVYQVYIDEEHSGNYKKIEVFPKIKIIPAAAKKIKVVSPNLVNTNDDISYKVFVLDRFNNVIKEHDKLFEVVLINLKTKEEKVVNSAFKIENHGFYILNVKNSDLEVEGSGIICHDSDIKLYWGDTHCHSNLSPNIRDNDCGATPYEAYTYAKETACLDYVALCEQTFELDDRKINVDKATWKKIGDECEKYNEEGVFVTFSGIETHEKRGDTVHIFKDGLKDLEYPMNKVKTVYDMWEVFSEVDSISIPHFHRYCNGRRTPDQQDAKHGGFQLSNWEKESEKEVLCEIFSGQWGRFESLHHPMLLKARRNVEGNTVSEFLSSGKQWGFTASSDGHDGNPGYSGLTGVLANEKTRDAIFAGMKKRRTIATTHPRTVVLFDIEEDNNNVKQESIKINLKVVSPITIKYVEIIKNSKVLKRIGIMDNYLDYSLEDDANNQDYYYVRVKLNNYHYAWASPIWIEKK